MEQTGEDLKRVTWNNLFFIYFFSCIVEQGWKEEKGIRKEEKRKE